jgi:hypothetical protein
MAYCDTPVIPNELGYPLDQSPRALPQQVGQFRLGAQQVVEPFRGQAFVPYPRAQLAEQAVPLPVAIVVREVSRVRGPWGARSRAAVPRRGPPEPTRPAPRAPVGQPNRPMPLPNNTTVSTPSIP